MSPTFVRRAILVTIVLAAAAALPGCATVFTAEPAITLAAGSSVCTASSLAECERLSKLGASLHTPEMNAAIDAVRYRGFDERAQR